MPETTLNGWKIAYEETGSGPPVFLAHGLLMDRTMFAPQVEFLRDRYRVITLDERNHGESEHRAEPYTQWDMSEDLFALTSHLGIERAVFGGMSQGGFQSLRLALNHPEVVAGLILIDTSAGAEDEVRGPMYEAFAGEIAANGWNDDILGVAAVSLFGESADDELKQHWRSRWQSQPTHATVPMLHAVTRRDDITERLSEIKAPALVIHGDDDVAIDIEMGGIMASGLGQAVDFIRVPGAGHTSNLEAPEEVNQAIDRFLSKVYPA